jgi:hypothetical protein
MFIQAGTATRFSSPHFDDRRGSRPEPPPAQANPGPATEPTQPQSEPFFVRPVGLAAGTFNVFVDLVSQAPSEPVAAHLFGPQDRKAPALRRASPQPSLTVLA